MRLLDATVQATAMMRTATKKIKKIKTRANLAQTSYESLKKTELEVALDEYIAENSSRFTSRPDLTSYFNSRSKALGSPVKKERESIKDDVEKPIKVAKRRVTKAIEDLASE